MAEFIVSSLINLLRTTIIQKAKGEARLLFGVEDEVVKLETNLNLIRGVLADAEEKKTKNQSIKLWLDSLKDTCFDMEDALDEWRTSLELDESNVAVEVCRFLSCFSFLGIGRRRGVAVSINKINKRLDEIAAARNRYQLESREISEHSTWRETSSFVEESDILGRDVEKSIILRCLGVNVNKEAEAEADENPIQTISLVGMGGLGKTALAQLVYNDDFVQEHFHEDVIWVCVSDIFDEKKVAKAIIQSIEKTSGSAAQGLETEIWQVLLQRVSDSIKGKKFFLIFDDVWGEKSEKWEELKACFKQGAPGSRILVTTRIVDVATMMGSSPSGIIHLEKLGDEACWSVLKQRALSGRRDNSESLEEVGRRIAARCKGLPLAAKTLGSLLKNKSSRREWESVMKSEIWELDLAQKDIFAPLLLSYNDLPPVLKRCFVSCIIYPKDRVLGVVDLIYQWMCRGYLGFDDDADLESLGRNYFDILANRSLFQDFTLNEDGIIQSCKMHDVVHDFVKYLVESEFVIKEVQQDDAPRSIKLEKCRHLTMLLNESGSFASLSISGAERLQSLAIFSRSSKPPSILESLPALLKESKRLKLLDLSEASDFCGQQIPNRIGGLIHLRWLSLQRTAIKQLPEALSNLRNLIVLDVSYSRKLEDLPNWIAKLINLRVLLTFDCEGLSKFPKEIRELTRLRYLLGAIVRADENVAQEFSIADLGNLKNLKWIHLILKGNSIDVNEAGNAQLAQLENLEKLFVSWKRSITKEDIHEAFNLPPDVLQFDDDD